MLEMREFTGGRKKSAEKGVLLRLRFRIWPRMLWIAFTHAGACERARSVACLSPDVSRQIQARSASGRA